MNKTHSRAVFIVAIALVLLVMPLVLPRYLIEMLTQMLFYALFAMSLNILVGVSGTVSFGHAAYFAIGGYACAVFLGKFGWPIYLAVPLAIAVTALCSLVIGYFCVRLTDVYFSQLTLAFSMLVWAVIFKWRDVTGGDDGLVGIPVPDLLRDRTHFYYLALLCFAVCVAAIWMITRSAFGRTLVAIKENPLRASFVGVGTQSMQLLAFVLAACFAAVAGILFALYNGAMFVDTAYWTASAQVLVMVLLGGIGHFFGPAAGAVALYLMEHLILQFTQYWPFFMGVILLSILLLLPEGLMSLPQRITRALARRKP